MKDNKKSISIFWFRRDLRLIDNAALYHALKDTSQVLPVFIFDKNILSSLKSDDRRIQFIMDQLLAIKKSLKKQGSDLLITYDDPLTFFKKIVKKHNIKSIYANRDYEPYATQRDSAVLKFCDKNQINFNLYKDHVIFEKSEILNGSQKPYTVFTPYKKKWLSSLNKESFKSYKCEPLYKNFYRFNDSLKISFSQMGFKPHNFKKEIYPELKISIPIIKNYEKTRNFPYLENGTTHLGVHLRFGTVSIRHLAQIAQKHSATWLSELIWRDFFSQILWHYPQSAEKSFKIKYEKVAWIQQKTELEKWKKGQTGYPLVDAGMRELNQTGHMHNRIRMVTASFLTKHLLHHWTSGERYFAEKLYDYDLASNVGNWQWAASTGCDAVPYFRIFNPQAQQAKFDPDYLYIKKWIPEINTSKYPRPMIQHDAARKRALEAFKKAFT